LRKILCFVSVAFLASLSALGADPPLVLIPDDGKHVGGTFTCCDSFGECEEKADFNECAAWASSAGHFQAAVGTVIDASESVGDRVGGACGVGRSFQAPQPDATLVQVQNCESVDASFSASSVDCWVTPIVDCGVVNTASELVTWPTFTLTSYVTQVPTDSADPTPFGFYWVVIATGGEISSAQIGSDPCVQ
jgi:hypothetical protein